jgi:BirA family biotin operon repressor/biotin-[acetyl-CoA-carboxylase] ligase
MSTCFPSKKNPKHPVMRQGMQILSVRSPWNNAPVYYREITSSTMRDAGSVLGLPDAHGSVVTADFQTHGRGRFATNSWESEKALNLLFTLVLSKKSVLHPESLVPLLAGLGVARAVERLFPLEPLIKWPNDILLNGKKTAGILCLGKKDYLLIGVGINCNQTSFAENRERATSLARESGRAVDRMDLLRMCLRSLKQVLEAADWRTDLEARLFLKGKSCTVIHRGSGAKTGERGVIMGVGGRGELVFMPEKAAALKRFYSAEISIMKS